MQSAPAWVIPSGCAAVSLEAVYSQELRPHHDCRNKCSTFPSREPVSGPHHPRWKVIIRGRLCAAILGQLNRFVRMSIACREVNCSSVDPVSRM